MPAEEFVFFQDEDPGDLSYRTEITKLQQKDL
jgi:hypothetical protein